MRGPAPDPSDPKPHAPEAAPAASLPERISATLRGGLRVAMFLDYDGTLREIESDPAAATPTPDLLDLLNAFARDDRLGVTLISGRTAADLESFVGHYPFGLVAEHGASIRPPRSRAWEDVGAGVHRGVADALRDVLDRYVASTAGSFVEEKRTGFVWHYRRADAQDGAHKARRLAEELSPIAAARGMVVRQGRCIVEVAPADVNKGAAVLRVLGRETGWPALVVVAGDDTTDESMFRLDLRNLVTIHVGGNETGARYRVPSPMALRDLLRRAIAPKCG